MGYFSFCGRDPGSATAGPPPEALSHIISSACRTQGGVHVHKDGLTVTSPVLMWVQVSLGFLFLSCPSPSHQQTWKFAQKPEGGSS